MENDASQDTPASAKPRHKWALTPEAFDRLLASLGTDPDSAGEKYLEIRRNLVRFFRWRGCPFPEDHADETINRVAKRIAGGEKVRDAASYSLGVARLLLLEIIKGRALEQAALKEIPSASENSVDSPDSDRRIECLRECLSELSTDNREFIVQYYQGEKGAKIQNRKRLVERFGISVNTLRMRALRLREKLQACVEACLRN